jgi:septum formation protein
MVLLEKLKDYRIILASQSPRRKQLLEGLGLQFEVIVREVDETAPPELVREQIPLYLAEKKAEAFDPNEFGQKTLIITADTIVWLNDCMLNKPTDFDSAVEMLTMISGGMHEVFTGVCVRTNTLTHSFFAESKVTFRHLDHTEIVHYINECQPFDKAGAYGIQEWKGYIGIEHIEGSFYNVMGLPTQMLYKELNSIIL